MAAQLKIDQVGLTPGVAGIARTDGLSTGATVTLTNTSSNPRTRFVLLWVPPGDTTAVASLAATGSPHVWTFSPAAGQYGTYLIELIQDEGLSTELRERRVLRMRLPTTGVIIPAFNEIADSAASLVNAGQDQIEASDDNATDYPAGALNAVNYTGWWRAIEELCRAVDSGIPPASQVSEASNVIWDPQQSTSAPRYQTWAEVYAAGSALKGRVNVILANTGTQFYLISGGVTFDLERRFSFIHQDRFGSGAPMEIAADTSLLNPRAFIRDAPGDQKGLLEVRILGNAASAPAIEIDEEDGLLLRNVKLDLDDDRVAIRFSDRSALRLEDNFRAFFAGFAGKILLDTASAMTLDVILVNHSQNDISIRENTFAATNAASILNIHFSNAQVINQTEASMQPTWTGTVNFLLLTDAFRVGYSPTVPGDWSAVPAQIGEALDTLAADAGSSVTGGNVGGGDADVFRDKIGSIINLRTVSGTGGIVVAENGDVIEVDGSSIVPGETNTAANQGGGSADVFINKTGVTLNLRTVSGTGGISVAENANVIEVDGSSIVPGETNLAANVGGGAADVFRDKTGVTLNFRTLTGVGGISVAENVDVVEFDGSALDNTGVNQGGGIGVFINKTGANLNLRSIAGTGGIVVNQNGFEIEVDGSGISGSGEANTGVNVGAGSADVFRDKTGVDLNFRTISGTGGISVSENVDVIEVDGSSIIPGETNLAANVGAGEDVFRDKTGVTFNFRTLTGTNGIAVIQNGDVLEVDGSGVGGSGEANTGTNVGAGEDVFRDKTGVTLNFRTLTGTNGIAVTQNGDVLEIDGSGVGGTGESNTGANVGAGEDIFRDKTGVALNFRTLTGTNGIAIVLNGDVLEVDGSGVGGSGESNTGANVGGGDADLFRDKTGVALNFRTLTGTNGIAVAENGDVVEIDGSVFALLAGRSGGQTLTGGIGSGENLTLESSSSTTKGSVIVEGNLDLSDNSIVGRVFGFITPPQLTAQADDYSPTGWGTTDVVRQLTFGSRTITGFQEPAAGDVRRKVIYNINVAGDLTLSHDDAASSVSNRILTPSDVDVVLGPGESATLDHDALSSRWRVSSIAANVTGAGESNTGANVGGGDADIFRDKTGVALNFRTLTGTNGITVAENGDIVEVDGSGLDNTAANLGGGSADVFVNKTGVTLNLRTISGTGGISVSENANVIEVDGSAIVPGETNTGANVGAGSADVFRDKTGASLNFRTISGTGGISVSENVDVIEVDGSAIIPGETNLAANVGAGEDVFRDKTGVTFNFRTLTGTNGIAVIQNVDVLEIDGSAVTGTGEVNTGTNVGTGDADVFRDKTGVTLNFRAISGLGGISVAENGNIVEVDGSGLDNTAANQGGGDANVFVNKTGVTLNLRTISGTGGIAVSENVNVIEIDGSGITGTGEANTGVNVGAGSADVFRDKTGVNLNFRTISGTGGISVSENVDVIEVDGSAIVPGETNLAANVGAGEDVFRDKTGVTFNFRTLTGTGGIAVTQNVDVLEIDGSGVTGTGEANLGANVGGGQNLFRDKTGVTLNFRTLSATGGLSVVQNGDELEVDGSSLTWTGLDDTPGSFTANALYRANAGGTALETSGVTVAGTNTTLPGDLTAGGDGLDFNTVTFNAAFNAGNSGAGTKAIDWNDGQKQFCTLTGDASFTFTDPPGPGNFVLILTQDATGSRSPTWPASSFNAPSATSGGNGQLDLSGGSSTSTAVSFYYDGTTYWVVASGPMKGSVTTNLVA